MLFEFALMPDLFDNRSLSSQPAYTIVFELLRGILDNGKIANLNKGRWIKYIYTDMLPNVDQPTRDMVVSLFNTLDNRHRIVRHPIVQLNDIDSGIDWLGIAMVSHQQIPFQAIVVYGTSANNPRTICSEQVDLLQILASPHWTDRRRSIDIIKTKGQYQTYLSNILRHARIVNLVDPFFNSNEKRYMDTVDVVTDLLGKRVGDRLPGRIQIQSDLSKQKPLGLTIEQYLNGWKSKLQPLSLSSGQTYRVNLWQSTLGSETLHDRYILTDQCGISTPAGLDCRSSSHANSTTWCLLDEQSRQLRICDYETSTTPYNLLGFIEINKNDVNLWLK